MARKDHASETPATQLLRREKVAFTEHLYDYVDRGGTAESSRQLGVYEHHVVKTLVMQDESARPLIVLSDDRMFTLPVALANLAGERVQDTELMMAGSVLTVLPVLVVFLFLWL